MSRGDGAGVGDHAQIGRSTLALVGALRVELADSLRAVSWCRDGERRVHYTRDETDVLDGRLDDTLDRRSAADERFEYAIDAYEELVVVTLAERAIPSANRVAGVALAVERDAPLREITAAIERAVAASRQ